MPYGMYPFYSDEPQYPLSLLYILKYAKLSAWQQGLYGEQWHLLIVLLPTTRLSHDKTSSKT